MTTYAILPVAAVIILALLHWFRQQSLRKPYMATLNVRDVPILYGDKVAPSGTATAATSFSWDNRSIMQMLVSLMFAGASLWIIIHGNDDPQAVNWASATLGVVGGFWLKL